MFVSFIRMQKNRVVRALEHTLDAGFVVCYSITEKTNEQWTDLIRRAFGM